MSCIGVNVVDTGHAFVWCDSEIYVGDEVYGWASKMAINALAAVVGVGCGLLSINLAAAALIQRCSEFDEIAARMPGALFLARHGARGRAVAHADHSVYAIAGLSRRFGRVVACVFDGFDDFSPRVTGFFGSPHVAGIEMLATDSHGVFALAQDQLLSMRKSFPNATGGDLIIAEVTGAIIRTRPAARLIDGEAPSVLSRASAHDD